MLYRADRLKAKEDFDLPQLVPTLRYPRPINRKKKTRSFQSAADSSSRTPTRARQRPYSSSRAPTRARQRPRFFLVGLGEKPFYLACARGSSASCRAAIPQANAVRNWSSASLCRQVRQSALYKQVAPSPAPRAAHPAAPCLHHLRAGRRVARARR
jgi:hypothetical protein